MLRLCHLACPLGRQMIQPAIENKYRFNMQVSARAMGCRDRFQRDQTTARRDRFFGISDQ
jgi:hypothetical protein